MDNQEKTARAIERVKKKIAREMWYMTDAMFEALKEAIRQEVVSHPSRRRPKAESLVPDYGFTPEELIRLSVEHNLVSTE